MAKSVSVSVTPNPIAVEQDGTVKVTATATNDGPMSARIRLSPSNDVYFAPMNKELQPAVGQDVAFSLVRGTGARSPASVKFFTTVAEPGTRPARATPTPIVDIAQ